MIEARHHTKRYGHTAAADEASFAVWPGRVTRFPAPDGAGKPATLRVPLVPEFINLTRDETGYHAGQLAGVSKGT
jgi:ABC-type Na+ transport system ATPase subunit NatA